MRRIALFSLLLVAGSTLTDVSWSDTPPRPAGNAATLSEVLNKSVDRHDAPGVVGLIVDRNGVLFEGASGKLDVARNKPMPADAIFNIASMTKPVTSVAIMQLVEQHKVALEDPVSKYLPGFDNLQVITQFNDADGTYQARPAKTVMTVRHLLTHTSGIGYGFSSPIVARLQRGNDKSEWEFPLLHEPGEKWSYGASTRVLGMIVEKVTGQSLEAYDQEHILQPLGMVDTSYAVPASKQSRLVTRYTHSDGEFKEQEAGQPVPATPTPPYRGDGGLYSTARDYGLFIRMFLNGGHLGNARILSDRSIHLMAQNQIGAVFVSRQSIGLPAMSKPFPLGAGRDKFGLGFQVTGEGPETATYRRAGSLSWAGLFNTEFWIDPKTGIGGVLLMQYLPFYDDGAIRTLRDFEAATYKELATAK